MFRLRTVFSLILTVISLSSLAQSNELMKLGKKEENRLFPFYYPNVNELNYYVDENALEKINRYRQEKKWEKLKKELEDYVKNFGIENFYKDTELIWQLAKLTELYGDFDDAKSLYRLALKHHQQNIDLKQMEIFLDSMKLESAKDYVPIDYYYELVDYRKSIDTLVPPRGVLLSMGENVNSKASDYAPTLSFDNKTIIFTSQRSISGILLFADDNEDLYIAHQDDGIWTKAKPIKSINSVYNEGSACLSKDGKTIYFTRCEAPDGFGNCDIYVTHMQEDSTWTEPENLGANINSKAWDSHPTLSITGDSLFFASDRIGGFGLSDIYFSIKDKNGNWTAANNLGPIINTRGNDVSPFIHPKHRILYFSSNGHLLNFGEFDIYKSLATDFLWDEPKNIGPLINTAGSEFYFTIDSESKDLFYAGAAAKNSDNLDLYSFPLPMAAQPEATTRVSGTVTDSVSGKPFKGIVSVIDLQNGVEIAPRFTRPDGSYEFDLINNTNYLLVIQSDKLFRIEQMFFLDGDTTINKSVDPVASRIRFKSIEFEENSAELRPDMYADLDKIVDFLLDYPEFKLKISGHTDSSGSERFNKPLSQERADAIRDYIILLHPINPKRVEAKGYGTTQPIVQKENTEDDRRLNRRVEFEIYRPKKEGN